MKKILSFSIMIYSLLIISCDSGGSGPESGGCTIEAAEGTWEMQSGVWTASGTGCIDPAECEDDTIDPYTQEECAASTNCGGSPGACEWAPEESFSGVVENFTCGSGPEEELCETLIVYSSGIFEQIDLEDNETDIGTWSCNGTGTEATITDSYGEVEIATVYISGDSMTLYFADEFMGCSLTASNIYLRTGPSQ